MKGLKASGQILMIVVIITSKAHSTQVHSAPGYGVFFCEGESDVRSNFDYRLSLGYDIIINKTMPATTLIKIKFDYGCTVILGDDAKFADEEDTINNIYNFIVVKDVEKLTFTVQGRFIPNHPPYVISLKINGVEFCQNPDQSYFERYPVGVSKHFEAAPDKLCGRRKISTRSTELIVSGSATKAGDWPWHTAIMRLKRSTLTYICGGTLISKYAVLTAGHCATINGIPVNPEILTVVLGKYSLVAKDIAVQEKEVFKVIVHDDFKRKTLANDIALLKLTTEAVFNNYVQPACLWFDGIYDHLGTYEIKGSVVGWGFDITDNLSTDLKEASMPQVPDITCIQNNPIFYTNILDGRRFCAGYNNGTTACNGDSGGGFVVFVEDDLNNEYYTNNFKEGAWYVKGIVSVTLARSDASICDRKAYSVFTDVAKYKDWILSNMK